MNILRGIKRLLIAFIVLGGLVISSSALAKSYCPDCFTDPFTGAKSASPHGGTKVDAAGNTDVYSIVSISPSGGGAYIIFSDVFTAVCGQVGQGGVCIPVTAQQPNLGYNMNCPSTFPSFDSSNNQCYSDTVTPTPTPTPAPTCQAGQNLGTFAVPVPGTTSSGGSTLINDFNKARAARQQMGAGTFTTCYNSCSATLSNFGADQGTPITARADGQTATVNGTLTTTGASCSNASDQPTSASPPSAPSTNPAGPADCPSNTTFGQVQGQNVCVNNAPLPSQNKPSSDPASSPTADPNANNPGPNQLDPNTSKTGTNSSSSLPSNVDGCLSNCSKLTSTTPTPTPSNPTPTPCPTGQTCTDTPGSSKVGATTPDKSMFYTPGADKLNDVISDFSTKMQQSPIFSGAAGFFNFSGGGSCPTWTIPSVKMPFGSLPSVYIDQFCGTAAQSMYFIIKAVLICVATFFAFRWAIL